MQQIQPIWFHVVTVVPLLLFKLFVLLVGYLITKLGYDLLIKGVSGQFKFHGEIKGGKADLVSASPGVFFVLMGAILIAIGIIKDKPFETIVEGVTRTASGTVSPSPSDAPPQLPSNPPMEIK
jgi:hypothetical protein